MSRLLASALHQFASLFERKAAPPALTGTQWTGTGFVDSYKRNRNPTPNELMAELKGTAWTCISLNSQVCASNPPSLYVVTRHNQPRPKCLTKSLPPKVEDRLRSSPSLSLRTKSAATIEEVTDHPLLTLLNTPNPIHNGFDLWELTTLYQEVHGSAYWYLDMDGFLGVPNQIWILPSQNVTPMRSPDSANVVDFYKYRTGTKEQLFDPATIIHFRYPDPRDPYTGGLSPLRACFEQAALTSDYSATKKAVYENTGIPSALVTPEEVIGEEERDRLESQWNQRFRRGGSGKVVVAESALKVQLLQHSLSDLAALAEMGATKDMIANAFHVPVAFFTTNTNLANLLASQSQHMDQAVSPRLERRDEKLNAQLVPLFDPTGRLFLASDDPTPVDGSLSVTQQIADLQYGVVSINEVRSERGLPAVPWGNVPWLPQRWLPTDVPRTQPGEKATTTGRNQKQKTRRA